MTAPRRVRLSLNIPNFGAAASASSLYAWAEAAQQLGVHRVLLSDHVVITDDVAKQYPAPFAEPLTTISWLAGRLPSLSFGTSVLVAPYHQPLESARTAGTVAELIGGRLVLGVGIGWARQEFGALGLDYTRRGEATDRWLAGVRRAWSDVGQFPAGPVPLWVGGNSRAARRRAVLYGDAWHPIDLDVARLLQGRRDLADLADAEERAMPAFVPRVKLRLGRVARESDRQAGTGTLGQIVEDVNTLAAAGAEEVVLDPFDGNPGELADSARPLRDLSALVEVAVDLVA